MIACVDYDPWHVTYDEFSTFTIEQALFTLRPIKTISENVKILIKIIESGHKNKNDFLNFIYFRIKPEPAKSPKKANRIRAPTDRKG